MGRRIQPRNYCVFRVPNGSETWKAAVTATVYGLGAVEHGEVFGDGTCQEGDLVSRETLTSPRESSAMRSVDDLSPNDGRVSCHAR